MYPLFQKVLIFVIEAVAIVGYGSLFAHYILTHHLESSKTEPIDLTDEQTADIRNTNIDTALELGQIEQLTLRQCRAVIRSLNARLPKSDRIRLKINGKDAPTSWLRLQIKQHLENRQQQVAPILEEILKAS
ncbi:MAG: hypothetical protein F6K32_09560 [Desertifilum sp. SIO1I2]|nr:hypothetical protein [Desertifilum sp. SIO1I2]